MKGCSYLGAIETQDSLLISGSEAQFSHLYCIYVYIVYRCSLNELHGTNIEAKYLCTLHKCLASVFCLLILLMGLVYHLTLCTLLLYLTYAS